MQITRFSLAPFYQAPGHQQMSMRRLQGKEVGHTDSVWFGLSVLEPGGGTTSSASPVEKFYLVIEGELTVEASRNGESTSFVLGPLDSCRIEPGEARRLHNHTGTPCKVLLVMANN
jgi:mannose-6-phosphate isomerase-like protein (cupin superfamily)